MAKLVTDVYVNAATRVSQDTEISNNNTQVISISGTQGDVIIDGNTVVQKATLNVASLMKAVSSQDVQQKITAEIDQLAKSLVSGLNFLTFSNAKSTADNLVKAASDITAEISNACASRINNNQLVIIESTRGTVKITNNLFSQVNAIVAACFGDVVSRNSAVQDMQAKISQSTSSELSGFDLVWLLLVVGAVLVIPLVAGASVGRQAIRFVFPVSMIVGGVMFGVYWATSRTEMRAFYYTKPYGEFCPGAEPDASAPPGADPVQACLDSPSCAVVDVRKTIVDGSKFSKRAPELATFYRKGCLADPEQYSEPASSFPAADVTAVKYVVRKQWILYTSLALGAIGLVGTLVQAFVSRPKDE